MNLMLAIAEKRSSATLKLSFKAASSQRTAKFTSTLVGKEDHGGGQL